MPVNQLRREITDAEMVHFAAYYEIKAKREEESMEKAKRSR